MSFDVLYEIRLEGKVNKIISLPLVDKIIYSTFPRNSICNTLPQKGVVMHFPDYILESRKAKVIRVVERGAKFKDVESGKNIKIPAVYIRPL